MALNTCPDCRKPVSSEATACPHCGRPQAAAKPPKAETRLGFKILGGIIVALFVWAWLSSLTPPTASIAPDQAFSGTRPSPIPKAPAEEPVRPIYKTTALDLVQAYDRNEVATNKAIGNAIVEIQGPIASIDMDAMNHAVIEMETGVAFEHVGATLEDSQKNLAASLVKDQVLTVRCKKIVRVIGSPRGDDCVIVQ